MARLTVMTSRITIDGLEHGWHIDLPIDAPSEQVLAAITEAKRIEAVVAQMGKAGVGFSNAEVRSGNERVNGRVILPTAVADVILTSTIQGDHAVLAPIIEPHPDDPERNVIAGWRIEITHGVEGSFFGPPINITVGYRPDITIGRAHIRQDWAEHLASLAQAGDEVHIEPAYIKRPDGSVYIAEFSVVPGPRVLGRRADDKKA